MKVDVLNATFPGLGHDWSKVLSGTTTTIFFIMANYVRHWEAVAARWVEGDHTLLQPVEPCWAT